jgi:hypothetical protein
MNVRFEAFTSGWIGLIIALRPSDRDQMISLLKGLKEGEGDHFHLRATDFSANDGVADIEIATQGEGEPDNMTFG